MSAHFLSEDMFKLSVGNSGRPIPPEALENYSSLLPVKMLAPARMA